MFIKNGKMIDPSQPFVENGLQYPGNWISRATQAEREAVGITEVPDPVRPDDRYNFVTQNEDGTYTTVRKPTESITGQIWNDIKIKRDYLTQNGGYKVVVNGVDKWFHSDIFSRSQQIGLVILGANIPPGLTWKTMDGSFVPMTQSLAAQVFAAAAASDQAIFAKAEQHKAAMEAAEFPEQYDWRTDWPAQYTGS